MRSFLLFAGIAIGIYLYKANYIVYGILILSAIAFTIYRFKLNGFVFLMVGLLSGTAFTLLVWFVPYNDFDVHKGMVIESKSNYFVLLSGWRKLYVSQPANTFEIFDIVTVNGSVKEVHFKALESRFDFQNYLYFQGITREITVKSVIVEVESLLKLREFQSLLTSGLSETTKSFVNSYVFGATDYGSEFVQAGSFFGLTNLFSLGGLFIYGTMVVIEYVVELKFSKRVGKTVSIVFLVILLFLSMFKLSIIRLVVVNIIRYLNRHVCKRKMSGMVILSISALVILAINPFNLFSSSFFIPFTISWIFLLFKNVFERHSRVKRSVFTTIVIFVLLIPYTLEMNNQINLLSVIFQPIYLLITVPTYCISWLSILRIPFDWYFKIAINSAKFFADLEIVSKTVVFSGPLSDLCILVHFSLVVIVLHSIDLGNKRVVQLTSSVLVFSLMLIFVPYENLLNDGKVHFIDVGQGDATLIKTKFCNVLIDTGGNTSYDTSQEIIIPYLKKQKIYKIDYLITTHDDFDHIGGVPYLLNNFDVGTYVKEASSFPIKTSEFVINNLNAYKDPMKDENYNSLVLSFRINGLNYLIMGDAPKEIEAKIIEQTNIECDVLKVGHHGSNTSTSELFIRKISPSNAVISCGYNNRYGHPHRDVLNTLLDYRVNIRRTDLEGTIIL